MRRIVARTAVTEPDVEVPVGPEHQMASVVIRKGLCDEPRTASAAPAQGETRPGIRGYRIRRPLEPRNDRVSRAIREVDEEAAARGDIGRERQAEKPLFASADDGRRKIQEIVREDSAVANCPDVTILLDHQLDVTIRRVLHVRQCHREPGGLHARAELRIDIGTERPGQNCRDEYSARAHARYRIAFTRMLVSVW